FSGVLAAPEQFAAALVRLLHDAGLRQRLSVNGRTLIEARYSWTAVAAQYERLYRSIAGE
ncbi:MAG: glycosyltransferase, partial [Phototrophicaceae bacterium]